MADTKIIRGITLIDPEQHIAISDYRRQAPDEDGVHVIEMANGIAEHLGSLMLVFGRWITTEELERRKIAYDQDPTQYTSEHLKSLSL